MMRLIRMHNRRMRCELVCGALTAFALAGAAFVVFKIRSPQNAAQSVTASVKNPVRSSESSSERMFVQRPNDSGWITPKLSNGWKAL